MAGAAQRRVTRERNEILVQLEDWLEPLLVILGFLWLILLIIELVRGLTPFLESAVTLIWIVFIADFLLRFSISPDRRGYLRRNWLTALSLTVPALRLFRALRAFRLLRMFRASRGLRLVRVLTSMNRGMRALGASMSRRGFGYAIALTAIVLFAGAAGMFAFENAVPGGLDSYGDALWWTAMLLTSMGSEYWPRTGEGRMLCLVLAVYGFAVFGYVTAVLASFFVETAAERRDAGPVGSRQLRDLGRQMAALRAELRSLPDRRSGG